MTTGEDARLSWLTANTRVITGDEVAPGLGEVADKLAAADSVLITCHRGPDGDSVGSMIALAALLRGRGKRAVLYNPDQVPRRLKWLPLVKRFVRKLGKNARFPVTVVVDCAAARLLGTTFPGREVTGEVIALDHHTAAEPFGDLYVCDPAAASVGVLVARMARRLGWSIGEDAAVALYVSLVSDTGAFRYANTNPEALSLAAELVAAGVDPWQVSERLFERASLSRYRLLARAIDGMELLCGGKVALMTVTREVLEQAGATWEDSIDLVSYARALDGVECGVLLTSAKKGGARVSMRSKGQVDAGEVCAALGGGGHRGAAGCVIDADLAGAREQVGRALARALGTAWPEPAQEPVHEPAQQPAQQPAPAGSASSPTSRDRGQ